MWTCRRTKVGRSSTRWPSGSDLVLQSFRAGSGGKRQGVDAETLRAINPDLVYLSSPGYGIDGPCGDRPAYAPTIGAGSGLVMRNIGAAIKERPGLSLREIRSEARRLSGRGTTEYAQADGISALTAASAMLLGLLVRDRVGCLPRDAHHHADVNGSRSGRGYGRVQGPPAYAGGRLASCSGIRPDIGCTNRQTNGSTWPLPMPSEWPALCAALRS